MRMLQQKIILFFGFTGVIVSVAGEQNENRAVFIAGFVILFMGFLIARGIEKYARKEMARRRRIARAREQVFRFYRENKMVEERAK